MVEGIYSAAAGMINQQTMLEVITNNLANVSTSGYKRDELSFSGTLNTLPKAQPEAYAVKSSVYSLDTVSARFATDYTQGGLQRTDNPLDLALDGDGFFAIQYANGIRYTRSGNFSLDSSGQLATADGYPVLGVNGIIQIRGKSPRTRGVEIDSIGQVIVDGTRVAKLRLAHFQDTSGLIKAGDNTFIAANATAVELPAAAEVRQGFLESSNVNVVYEMAKMIEAMRVYESYQKTIQLINQTLEKANNQLGKISV